MQITSTLYVNDIVNDALRFLRQSTQFRALSGYDEELGIKMLNEVLADLSGSGSALPFFVDISFNTVASQQKYYIGNGPVGTVTTDYLPLVAFINITEDGERLPVKIISDKEALSAYVSTTIEGYPGAARVYFENDTLGITYTIIDFLYTPEKVYAVTVRGKPSVAQVGLTTILTGMPLYFRSFLKLATARKLVNYFGIAQAWTKLSESQYQEALQLVERSVEKDLEVVGDSALLRNGYYNYFWNLGVIT